MTPVTSFLLVALLQQTPGDQADLAPPRLSLEVVERVDVDGQYPMALGTSWTYRQTESQSYGGGRGVYTARWTQELVVVGHQQAGAGLLVVRATSVRDLAVESTEPADADSLSGALATELPRRPVASLYVLGPYVYDVRQSSIPHLDEPGTVRELVPAFFFPLSVGLHWSDRAREEADYAQWKRFESGKGGAPNPGMYYWVVEDVGELDVAKVKYDGVYRLVHRTVGGLTRVWFKPGVGVVRREFVHSGSTWETHSELVELRLPDD